MQHSTVQDHLVMNLVVSHELSLRIMVDAAYEAGDPYAVRFTFHLPGNAPVTWFFARELLLDGIGGPAGEGDVHVRPDDADPTEVRVVLRSPDGDAVLRAPAASLAAFLARTDRLVPVGRELDGRELDAELANILRGRENAG
ncbi:SsgA family sporulation/cell division regulator [Kitasatospora sp. NPDC059577]|uniref:SsgA family sporulation/cell division regulator n=1 Tax=Kitasatospora sp. NPDC059577 TaxID=3346873 RepID=UPI0036B7C5D0